MVQRDASACAEAEVFGSHEVSVSWLGLLSLSPRVIKTLASGTLEALGEAPATCLSDFNHFTMGIWSCALQGASIQPSCPQIPEASGSGCKLWWEKPEVLSQASLLCR